MRTARTFTEEPGEDDSSSATCRAIFALVLMVIFGAGASAGSANFEPKQDVGEFRLPMGRELFADRPYMGSFIDTYGEVRPIVHRFRGAENSIALEAGLEDLQRRSANRAELRKQLAALRYYLQRVIVHSTKKWSDGLHGVTNYVGLVHELDERWCDERKTPVIYVTFNYDTLLDGALGQLGVFFGPDLESYLANERHRLFKPHGSVNWFHPVLSGLNTAEHPYSRQIITKFDYLTISPDFVTENEHADIDDIQGLPALLIPVATKSEFEMPATHLTALKSVMPSVTHLLIIGWRANEAHFRALLSAVDRSKVSSLVVSSAAPSAASTAKALNLQTDPPSGHNFSTLVGSKELEKFLAT